MLFNPPEGCRRGILFTACVLDFKGNVDCKYGAPALSVMRQYHAGSLAYARLIVLKERRRRQSRLGWSEDLR